MLFFLPLFILAPLAQADSPRGLLNCTAIYRAMNNYQETISKSVPLRAIQITEDFLNYRARLEDREFRVSEHRRNGDLFGQILNFRSGTQGATSRGLPDSEGRFTAAEVDGTTVYRLECSRR